MTITRHPDTETILDDLDFDVSCCCDFHGCPHGRTTECDQPATLIVTLHLVNGCNRPHCDPDGNTNGPMCLTCLERIVADLRNEIAAIPKGFRGACLSCGAPIAHIADVIREVRAL